MYFKLILIMGKFPHRMFNPVGIPADLLLRKSRLQHIVPDFDKLVAYLQKPFQMTSLHGILYMKYKNEDIEFISSLHGEELVFFSGLSCTSEEWLKRYITELDRRHVGLVSL